MQVDAELIMRIYEEKVLQLTRETVLLKAENISLIKELEELKEKKDGLQ